MFTTCLPHAHNMFTTCSPHPHHMFTKCSPHVHLIFTTYSPHVHNMLRIFTTDYYAPMDDDRPCFNIYLNKSPLVPPLLLKISILVYISSNGNIHNLSFWDEFQVKDDDISVWVLCIKLAWKNCFQRRCFTIFSGPFFHIHVIRWKVPWQTVTKRRENL